MNKDKTHRVNTAIQKAVKLYFNGKTTECFDLLETIALDEQTTGKLKKNLAVASCRRTVRAAHPTANS